MVAKAKEEKISLKGDKWGEPLGHEQHESCVACSKVRQYTLSGVYLCPNCALFHRFEWVVKNRRIVGISNIYYPSSIVKMQAVRFSSGDMGVIWKTANWFGVGMIYKGELYKLSSEVALILFKRIVYKLLRG
ncbi:hypothetical protein, partial [Caldisericum sp.]|uniref:hypothetical protein n=1 Tax=Caldisericum sp. TaxID=2499687 RepID=UPI003D148ADC